MDIDLTSKLQGWIVTVQFTNSEQKTSSFRAQLTDYKFELALMQLCEFCESVGVNIGEYYLEAYTSEIKGDKGVKLFSDNNPFHAPFKIDHVEITSEDIKQLSTKKLDEFN